MLSAVHTDPPALWWGVCPAHFFACIFRWLRKIKKLLNLAIQEPRWRMDSNAAASASGGVLHTSVSVKKHWRTCLFFHLLLRTRLFCRSQVPYQAPPLSDGGLFSSTLGVKRQAPPLPCFVLDKKLTISCRYPGLWAGGISRCSWPGQATHACGCRAGQAARGCITGKSCGPNPRRLYCARCKQGV